MGPWLLPPRVVPVPAHRAHVVAEVLGLHPVGVVAVVAAGPVPADEEPADVGGHLVQELQLLGILVELRHVGRVLTPLQ